MVRLVLVQNDECAASALQNALSALGHEPVATCQRPEAALEVGQHCPGLVVVECGRKKALDGVIGAIRLSRLGYPLLAVSAYGKLGPLLQDYGIHHLRIPYSVGTLQHAVVQACATPPNTADSDTYPHFGRARLFRA